MKKEIIQIQSISQLHALMGYDKPKHPLVTVLDYAQFRPNPTHHDTRFVMNFYVISLKSPAPQSLLYGRQYYDFEEGTLMYIAPNQVILVGEIDEQVSYQGWGLYFHPDIINGTTLGKRIKDYSFFSYNANEALHVSEDEKSVLNQIAINIAKEYQGNIDVYTNTVIITYIEQILNYSQRFYGRQFITRQKNNHELMTKFEALLNEYFDRNLPTLGLPRVEYFAEKLNLSADYLSDLLKKETGKSTRDFIQHELLEQAKYKLLNTNNTVNEIAYSLGFEYPQYFNRLFKNKIGITPNEYRNLS